MVGVGLELAGELVEGFGCPLDARFAKGAELALVLRAGKRSGAASRRPFGRLQPALFAPSAKHEDA